MHAAAGVGDAERLERALHGAVLAEAAVQRDEHAREAFALQVEQVALGRIERRARRRPSRAARASTALPDMSEISRSADGPPISTATLPNVRCVMLGLPTIRTSGSRSTPVFCAARSRARARSAPRCPPRCAAPFGLTMKFACFSDTRAPPTLKPLSPHDSISRAAWSPAGCGTRCRRWAATAAGSRCAARAAP